MSLQVYDVEMLRDLPKICYDPTVHLDESWTGTLKDLYQNETQVPYLDRLWTIFHGGLFNELETRNLTNSILDLLNVTDQDLLSIIPQIPSNTDFTSPDNIRNSSYDKKLEGADYAEYVFDACHPDHDRAFFKVVNKINDEIPELFDDVVSLIDNSVNNVS